MLDPRERRVLLEALRPPEDYVLTGAIAMTYSLDLTALLTAPLAFSMFDSTARGDDAAEQYGAFELLQAVRQHAARLVVFCEPGCIIKPAKHRQLFAYLEDCVVPVRSRSQGGVFHPKLWLQRFAARDVDAPIRYRLLCASRNITFDRCWDTLVTLEGDLADRTRAIGSSRPLGEFVEATLGMALGPVSSERRELVRQMADEVQRVRFESEPFDEVTFWPMGHEEKHKDPFEKLRTDRLLVVSPFLADERLRSLRSRTKEMVLVSRSEELDALRPSTLAELGAEGVFILRDAASDLDEQSEDDVGAPRHPVPTPHGLHAKLYVADDGWNAHVWTGSANASNAAFSANVELLVQLTGKKSQVGVEATLGESSREGLSALLVPYEPPQELTVVSAERRELDQLLTKAQRALSRTRWTATASKDERAELFDVRLEVAKKVSLPSTCDVKAWPISLREDRAAAFDGQHAVTFQRCSFESLTTFFAIEVAASVGSLTDRVVFVVVAPLQGAPADRLPRILRSLLDDPSKVAHFLRLLLTFDEIDRLDILQRLEETGGALHQGEASDADAPLLESLLRAFDRDPARLDEVDRLVNELRSTSGASLPVGFEEAWTPIWAAHQARRAARKRQ